MVSSVLFRAEIPFSAIHWLSFEARLIASEWTVRLSGFSFLISSMVWRTSPAFSPGSPKIISILMLENPALLAMAKASFTCSTVCLLPIKSRVSCFMVWGFTEILVTPLRFKTSIFSGVMLSARPASTVNSFKWDRSKLPFIFSRSLCIWKGSRVVGVPPPM